MKDAARMASAKTLAAGVCFEPNALLRMLNLGSGMQEKARRENCCLRVTARRRPCGLSCKWQDNLLDFGFEPLGGNAGVSRG